MFKKRFIFRIFFACLFASYPLQFFSVRNISNASAETVVCFPSKAECVMEMHTRRILYESRGDFRLPMASTTKIATCITALELCMNIQESFPIPKEATGIEGSSVYLQAGEKYSVEDLLYGLMLRSGNDCAVALALQLCGSVEVFSSKMNEIAEKSGALATNFVNPHGLPSAQHYTTARDLACITSYALHNADFAKIVSTKYYTPRHWKNKNKMLDLYDGSIGVKTGYTKEAGRCLVTAAKRENATLVCVVLNSPNMYERSAELLNDAFENYEYTKLVDANDEWEIVGSEYKGKTNQDFYYPLLKEEKPYLEIITEKFTLENSKEIIGKIQIYLSKRLLFSGNLYKL